MFKGFGIVATYEGCHESVSMSENKQNKNKDKNMKTNRIAKTFGASTLALATALLAAFTLADVASAQSVGADGIVASPKLRQALNEKAAYAIVAKAPAMACSKCAEVRTTQPSQAKGAELLAGAATKVVIKHTCGGCDTKLAVAGTGKAKQTVATHTCTAAVANNLTCCSAMK
jgi:hypothetical protein